ncbi:MAG: dienelactone hydrolase [Bradymonadia bacterium]|jgi:dienelactone hydrolase
MRHNHLLSLILLALLGCDDGGGMIAPDDRGAPDMTIGDMAAGDMTAADMGGDMAVGDMLAPDMRPPEMCAAAPFAAPGPYPAGVTTIDMNGSPLEVWYPAEPGSEAGTPRDAYDMRDWLPPEAALLIADADAPLHVTTAWRDLPIADVSAPLVLFSHGLAGYRSQSSFMTAHLATWGFIVASPEHVERGLATILANGFPQGDNAPQMLRDVRAFMPTVPRFMGVLDAERVASSGHSMGTLAARILAEDDGVDAWVALAGAGFGAGPDIPAMIMGGTTDLLAQPGAVANAYAAQPGARRLVSIQDAGHLAFSDICAIGRDRGGVLAIAVEAGIDVPAIVRTLGSDGCRDTDLPVEEAWPVINHFVTAHLRAALMDETTGLDDAAAACFGDRMADFQQATMPDAPPEP